ncbi:g5948 [Coccomyxa viridis]|uniref:G5948 protein n=1 Tax=Coccomyxa viridis TaxID=1274662 RepID=A0ABP1FU70_9CHLO
MSLKTSIVGVQVKHIKGALQYLAKIGSEVLIEALPEKLILRSINSSRSAYASISFINTFFDAYNIFGTAVVQAGVLAKHALSLFRTQRIVKIFLEVDTQANKLIANIWAENGLEKRFTIPCMNSEILQTAVDKDSFPTCVNAAASELNRLLSSFQNNLDEITIIATPDDEDGDGQTHLPKAVQLHSFLDPAKGHAEKSLHTQLAVDTREVFLDYRHNSSEATDVTFNLKDFKAVLVLCEGLGTNVALCFDQPGSPLLVHPVFHSSNPLEEYVTAELVLATLLETARLGDSGPATVAANARRRVDTPGAGGQIPGDTPWQPGSRGFGRTSPATANGHSAQPHRATTGARPSRFQPDAETPRMPEATPAQHRSAAATPAAAAQQQQQTAPRLHNSIGTDGPPTTGGDSALRFRRTPLGRSAATPGNPFDFPSGSDSPADADRTAAEPSMGREGRTGRPTPSGLLDDGQFSEAQDDHCEEQGAEQSMEARIDPHHRWRAQGEGQDAPRQGKPDSPGQPQHGEPEGDGAPGHPQPGGFQESEWQGDEPISRRYLAADILHDEDDDMDEDAIPGTP